MVTLMPRTFRSSTSGSTWMLRTSTVVSAIDSGEITDALLVDVDQRVEVEFGDGSKKFAEYIDGQGIDLQKQLQAQVESGAITRNEALMQVTATHLEAILHTQFEGAGEVIATGIAASPGAAVGRVYFTADDALDADDRGDNVILVRNETTPADVMGMQASQGLLTSRGGLASHAALVARGWGTPAIVGAQHIEIGESSFTAGDVVVRQGDAVKTPGR